MFGDIIRNQLKQLLFQLSQAELKKIQRYKDLHRGEGCYIVGDGVSIKWFDLTEFTDKISISVSLIPFHRDFKVLNSKYLTLAEPFWFYPGFWTKNISNSTSMPYISKAYRDFIKTNLDRQFFLNISNYPVLRSENVTYLFNGINDKRLMEPFISRRINAFHGSLRFSILLAIYMGFEHVFLVGCDYTHVPSRSRHWYEKGRGVFVSHENYQKLFFEIAKEFIEITTITLDGTSDFINALTYKKYTGREPVYKENTELVDDRYLKLLSTWPGYVIY